MQLSRQHLSYALMGYALLAFSWWIYLLHTKNEELYREKAALLQLQYPHVPPDSLAHSLAYRQIMDKQRHQRYMIWGEGAVLMTLLLGGMYGMLRYMGREAAVAHQQRNFILSVTHELKSPLASMRLVLETLRRRSLPPETSDRLLGNALTEADRLQHLIENLLLVAHVDNPTTRQLAPVDMEGIAEQVTDTYSKRYPDRRIELEVQPDAPHFAVEGDTLLLASLLDNLLENAIKYAPESPTIRVVLHRRAQQIVLSVIDRGPGVPDDQKRRIFERFYRIGNEEVRRTKGTGLGLYLARQIARQHGGDLTLRDNVPHGCVFRVVLPAATPKAVAFSTAT